MPELDTTIDEGFVLVSNGTIPYLFDNWLTPTQGSSDSYDFESDAEGYTITGVGTVPYTFDNWLTPNEGTSDTFDFESDDEGFSQSGNFCTAPYTFDDPMRTTADCT